MDTLRRRALDMRARASTRFADAARCAIPFSADRRVSIFNDVANSPQNGAKPLREEMPMPGMNYTIIKVGEGTGGGMMKIPMPGASSMWMPYVLVDDVKAAIN